MKRELIKSNYYEAVNNSWLEKAVIPGDQPQVSAFLELHLGIEKLLMDLAKEWSLNPKGLDRNMQNFVRAYNIANNFELKEKLGVKPYLAIDEKINKINSLKYLEENFKELEESSVELPFGFSVMQDFLNSNNQVLYFGLSSLILPDTSYYHNEESKEQLLELWKSSTTNVLKLYGLNDEEIKKLINDTIIFDDLLLPVTKSSVEQADYVKMYNPVLKDDVLKNIKNINLVNLANELVNTQVDKIMFINIDVLTKFDSIFNEENFEIIKSWIKVFNYLKFSGELTEELRVLGGQFSRALSGIKEAQDQTKYAFYKSYNYFNQAVGLEYAKKYFGEEAKEDVRKMVYEMIDIYKMRIKNNDWLNEKTKEKAIVKLGTLSVHVGYPDILPPHYEQIEVLESDNLLDIRLKVSKLKLIENYKEYNKAPNRDIWGMPASMVNAYYSPFNNQIVFPAAILQTPYYSKEQTVSENFGGIGAVIAHEISHAFDNNGAKFDETGSLKNWWTEEDLKAFDERSKAMIKLFDGLETGHGKCNGELTVSENIADSGGLRAALEASKLHDDHNLEEFFANWARVWRQKAQEQYAKLLLTVDVHGPSILRANMQLSNLEEFQSFYELKEEDKMYLSKEKMVSIW